MSTNVKSYAVGFNAATSVFSGVSRTKRAIGTAGRKTKNAVVGTAAGTASCIASFFSGIRQASRARSGKCRMIAKV